MDIGKVKTGDTLIYTGDSFSFGGEYTVVTAESTYSDPRSCPEEEQGKLMIIEFMNNGTPMYFTLEELDETSWKIKG